MKHAIFVTAFAAALSLTAPAAAQDRPYDLGSFWNVSAIDVEDGHFEDYMDFLSKRWRDNQAFAKQQGWLLEYHVLANEFPREGEPDLYLITRYADYPSTAELKRRDKIMLDRMKTTPVQADRESGERGKMRKLGSQMLLRELTFGR